MSSFITQCPHCSTSFRVSRDQLSAAHGAVRCGACLEVFNAARYLLADDAPPPASTAAAQPLPPSPLAQQPVADETRWIHDDLDLDGLDLDEELARLEAEERRFERSSAQLDSAPPSTDSPAPAARNEPTLTVDDAPPLAGSRSHEPTIGAATADEDIPAIRLTPVTAADPLPPSPLAATTGSTLIAARDDALIARREPLANTPPDRDEIAPTISASDSRTAEQRHEPEVAGSLFELDDEPLQLAWQQQRKPWGRWLLWGTLNLLALLALAGQYVAYNFDELARQDRYRPWFELLCPTLGCTVPTRVDVSQIRSSNLVVRSHPDFRGALIVDAILYNRASFSQPFPLLEIRFADLNGKLIASRSFKPSEYLSGELAGQSEMPPQVPIHIALDILDPGATAVNYSLNFQSPE